MSIGFLSYNHYPVKSNHSKPLASSAPQFSGRSKRIKELKQQNNWPKPAWYKKLYQQKWKIATLPFLAFLMPTFNNTNETTTDFKQAAIVQESQAESFDLIDSINNFHHQQKTDGSYIMLFVWTMVLNLVPEALLSFTNNHKSKLAHHEMGHFLALIGSGEPFSVKEVHTSNKKNYVSSHHIKSDDAILETVEYWKKFNLIARGGMNSEKAHYGFVMPYPVFIPGDKMMMAASDGIITFLYDKKLEAFKFILTADKRTEELLVHFDYKIVEELSQRLAKEGTWDAERVNEIIEEFKLDKVITDEIRQQILG